MTETRKNLVLAGMMSLLLGAVVLVINKAAVKTPILPYNGDVLSQRIPDKCEGIVSEFIGAPDGKGQAPLHRMIPVGKFGDMRNALDRCIAEARIDVHPR